MSNFKKLQSGEKEWSSTVREWLREHEKPNECIYCGSKENLPTEHILPRSCGGPDTTDNVIKACQKCNLNKGKKRLYEWKELNNKDNISRIAEGKYLKLLYILHENNNTLNTNREELKDNLCPLCNLKPKCIELNREHDLKVYCIEGCFHK